MRKKPFEVFLGLGEQPVGLQEVEGLPHHPGLHHLVEQGLLLPLLPPGSVLDHTHVRLVVFVKIPQSEESWLLEDAWIPDQ